MSKCPNLKLVKVQFGRRIMPMYMYVLFQMKNSTVNEENILKQPVPPGF